MRTLLLALALTSTSIYATEENKCKSIEGIASSVMQLRQMGVPLSRVYSDNSPDISKKITIEAYGKPAFSSKSLQKKAINEFANDWYLACLKLEQGVNK